ncbi:hypothetical protein AKJ16_DCAP03608 [Drosera capensis]
MAFVHFILRHNLLRHLLCFRRCRKSSSVDSFFYRALSVVVPRRCKVPIVFPGAVKCNPSFLTKQLPRMYSQPKMSGFEDEPGAHEVRATGDGRNGEGGLYEALGSLEAFKKWKVHSTLQVAL